MKVVVYVLKVVVYVLAFSFSALVSGAVVTLMSRTWV